MGHGAGWSGSSQQCNRRGRGGWGVGARLACMRLTSWKTLEEEEGSGSGGQHFNIYQRFNVAIQVLKIECNLNVYVIKPIDFWRYDYRPASFGA